MLDTVISEADFSECKFYTIIRFLACKIFIVQEGVLFVFNR